LITDLVLAYLLVDEGHSTVAAAKEKDMKEGAFPCFDSGEPTSLFLLSLSPLQFSSR